MTQDANNRCDSSQPLKMAVFSRRRSYAEGVIKVSPTIPQKAGTGGNNLPIVATWRGRQAKG